MKETSTTSVREKGLTPPKAKQFHKELTLHGHTRIDPYYWLRERENPEVIQYLEAENAYLKQELKPWDALREKIFQEIIDRIKQDDQSVPYISNGFWYREVYQSGQEYARYERSKEEGFSSFEVLLDVNLMASSHAYFQLGQLRVSPDNKFCAWSEDVVSRRIFTIRCKRIQDNATLPLEIQNTSGDFFWANDNATLFFVRKDETLRPYQVWKKNIHDPENEVLVFEEIDPTFYLDIQKSASGDYLLISGHSTMTSEVHVQDLNNLESPIQNLQPKIRELEYHVDHVDGLFYIRSNQGGRNFAIYTSTAILPHTQWQILIPHRPEVLIENFVLLNKHLFLFIKSQAVSAIEVFDTSGNSKSEIPLPEKACMLIPSVNKEQENTYFRFGYSSLTTPLTIFDYHWNTGVLESKKQTEVGGGFDASHYFSERKMILAEDGTPIPVSIVYHKKFPPNPNQPILIMGYGSYGISYDPYFSIQRLSLLNRGFSIAIAHVRGGEECGKSWYEDGRLLKKKNTFTDFIAVTKGLHALGISSPEHTYAFGGSAGGLLMGAVMNMQPNLFNGIIAAVPFVDVVTTMNDPDIPLTTGEYDEWGNPADPIYYEYMLSYSPYDQVSDQEYPHLLVTTGLHDSQVQYWEPAKWVAKLREKQEVKKRILLNTNMDTGHSGQSGRFKVHEEAALMYIFLLACEEMVEK